MRLCVIGDMHVYRLLLWPWHLFSKRVLGQANLWFFRRLKFQMKLMKHVVDEAMETDADLYTFTGDLTTTSLPGEFRLAKDMLEPILQTQRGLMVPGNHDAYTFRAGASERLREAFPDEVPEKFPYFTMIKDNWFALALDSATPRIFSSRGWLGHDQMSRIAHYLSTLGPHQGVVIVCHYPLFVPPNVRHVWNHDLADREKLAELVTDCRARVLFLHGHVHRPWCYRPVEERLSHVVDINAGAPVYCTNAYPYGQGFWHVDLPEDPKRPIEAVHHFRDETGDWRTSDTTEPA